MTGVSFRIERDDLGDATGALARIARPQAAMGAIGAYLVASTQRRFETQATPDGEAWTPLSPRTANRRVGGRLRGRDNILRVTTRLVRSISYEAGDLSVTWGSNLVYARVHQLGGTINIPERSQRLSFSRVRSGRGAGGLRFAKSGGRRAIVAEAQSTIGAHTVTIPARPYLGVSTEDAAEITRIVHDHWSEEIGR